jgi:hypothetical protein
MKRILSFLILFSILLSCNESKNKSLIVGNWEAVEWLVNGQPSANNAKGTSFIFKANSEYSFTHSGTVEKGNYKVVDDKLYTTPYDQQEMMVRIANLNADSLVFDMNRGGQPETLILVKRK